MLQRLIERRTLQTFAVEKSNEMATNPLPISVRKEIYADSIFCSKH